MESDKIVDPVIHKSAHPLLDAEALRVVNLMPPWKPGSKLDKPVKTSFILHINFQVN